MGFLSNQTGSNLVDTLKKVNPGFKSGLLYSDMAFNSFAGQRYGDIRFGTRINNGKGAIIGDDKNIYISSVKGDILVIPYSDIRAVETSSAFPYKRIHIKKINGSLDFTVENNEIDYVANYIRDNIGDRIFTSEVARDYSEWKKIKFKVVASDFSSDYKLEFDDGRLCFKSKQNMTDRIYISGEVIELQQITEENKSSILKKAGWGFAGGVIGGIIAAPLAVAGLLAGIIAKGNKKEISFACELRSGHKFVASTDNENYQKILTQLYLEK